MPKSAQPKIWQRAVAVDGKRYSDLTQYDTTAPSVPGTPAVTTVSQTALSITWSASTDAGSSGLAGYRLERATSSGGPFTQIVQQAGRTHSDTGLTAGTQYFYRVRAYDNAGNVSAYSAIGNGSTQSVGGGSGITAVSPIPTLEFLQNASGQTFDLDTLLTAGGPGLGWRLGFNPLTGQSFNDTTGVFSGTPTLVETVSGDVVVSDISKEDADYWYRASGPGVIWHTRFDADADVLGPSPSEADSSPTFYNAYCLKPDQSPGPNPYITRVVGGGIAGRNCMRLSYPAALTTNPGAWRRMFVDGQQRWPYDTPLYIMYTFRTNAATLNMTPFDNWKISLFAGYGKTGWGATCQGAEFATFHSATSYGNIIAHYTNCGGGLFEENTTPGPRFQNLSDKGPSETDLTRRYCVYNTYVAADAGGACYKYRPDVWTSLYFRLVPKSNGALDMRVEVQYEGSTTRIPIYEYTNFTPWGLQDASGNNCFNTIHLTLQTTGRSSAGSADIYLDFAEVMVATQPIPPRTVWA